MDVLDELRFNQCLAKFSEIMSSVEIGYERSIRLAELMTSIEVFFAVPLLTGDRLDKFIERFPTVWSLYQQVSESRYPKCECCDVEETGFVEVNIVEGDSEPVVLCSSCAVVWKENKDRIISAVESTTDVLVALRKLA